MRLRVPLLLAAAIALTLTVALCVAAGAVLASRLRVAPGMAFVIGDAKDFPAQTVELRMLPGTFLDHHPDAAFFAAVVARRPRRAEPWPVPAPVSPVPVYLAADERGELCAFYQRDPRSGCLFPWQRGENAFADPCSGAHYRLSGECVDGPCVRGLDRFGIERRIDGRLVVRIDRFMPGSQPGAP